MAGEGASTGPERNPPPKEIPEAPANAPAESEPTRAAASRSGARHASRSVPPGEGQKKENAPAPVGTAKTKGPQQGMLNLEPANRGRFEKSEPTIIDGENLDVPTYLRQGMGERDA